MEVGYDEIALSPENQIKRYIENIDENNELYNALSDLEIYEKLNDMCSNMKLQNLSSKLHVVWGDFYTRMGSIERAYKYYSEAVEILDTKLTDYNLLLEALYRFSFVAYRQQNITLASKYFIRAEDIYNRYKNEIENKYIYFFHYYYGIHLITQGQYVKAREKFKSAGSVSFNERSKSAVISNIGVTYKKQGDLEKAIELYREAIDVIENSYDITKISLYNNLAEAYRAYGELDKAMECINIAFELAKSNESNKTTPLYSRLMHLYDTYININLDLKIYNNNLNKLKECLINMENHNIDKYFVIEHIYALIKLSDKRNDVEELDQISKLIIYLIKKYDNEINIEFQHNLKACLGDIMLIKEEREEA